MVSDADGEWIEIYNAGTAPADLAGSKLEDGQGKLVLLGAVTVPTKGRVVIGASTDKAKNGGVDVAWAWGGAFALPNTGKHTVRLVAANGSTVLDEVTYVTTGKSFQLWTNLLDAPSNDAPTSWCLASDLPDQPKFGPLPLYGTPGGPSKCAVN